MARQFVGQCPKCGVKIYNKPGGGIEWQQPAGNTCLHGIEAVGASRDKKIIPADEPIIVPAEGRSKLES